MTQPLTTPVVSVATPSLLTPFSAMPTAYNTGENDSFESPAHTACTFSVTLLVRVTTNILRIKKKKKIKKSGIPKKNAFFD